MKKENELQKVTLNLHPGDYDRLRELFPETGAGPIIRRLVRKFIEQTETNTINKAKVDVQL